MSNIRQSGRVRKTVDYTFSEFDQEILEAVDRDGRNTRAAQNSQSITPARVGIRQSKRRRMLYNDSDSDSNYDPGSPMVEPHIPKHPERHVYLRRHENGVEIGNSNDVEKEKQQNVLSEDDRSLSESAALQSDEAVYRGSHGTSLDKNKLTNPASFGATSNQYGECEDVEGSMDTVTEISDCSLVQNNKTSDTTSQSQSNPSVNATIQANESSTSNPIEHNKSTNIGLPNKQDTIPLNLSEDSVTSSNDNTQVNTSTAENICSDDNIINGNEYACAESNSRLLDNRDVNLLKQENEQADLIQKNPDHRYESPTFA